MFQKPQYFDWKFTVAMTVANEKPSYRLRVLNAHEYGHYTSSKIFMKINSSQQGLVYIVYESIWSIHCLYRASSILWQVEGNFLLPKRACY